MSLIADIHDDMEQGAVRLITEYRARLFSDAVRLCDNASDAEDLVNRTFIKVLNRIDQHNPDKDFYGWMKTILVNLHRDDLDRPVARGTVPVEDSVLAQHAGADWSTDEQILKNSDGEAVREALRHIDPEFRQLVLLRYYDEFSLKEIASILNKPIGTVSRRIQIALRLLAGKLEAELGNSKAKLAAFAAFLLAGSLFGAAIWGVVEAVKAVVGDSAAAEVTLGSEGSSGTIGSLESEEPSGSSAADSSDPSDSMDSSSSTIASKDPIASAGPNFFTSISTTENNKEETMNLNSITRTAAKLSVGVAMATGLAANVVGATSETDKGSVAYKGRAKLFAQWDAVDNVGLGTHDDAATLWRDLVGSCDMTKNGSTSWESRAAVFSGGWFSCGSAIPACKMFEIVFESPDPWGTESYGLCEFASSGIEIMPYSTYLIISSVSQKQAVKRTGKHVLTIDCTTSPWATYYDGELVSERATTEKWNNISYNAIGRTFYKVFAGRIHSVRLYNDVLTAEEIAYNAIADDVRFFKDASDSFAIDEIPAQTLTGEPVCPAVTVRDPLSGEIVSSDCYDVEYANNVEEGYASVIVKGKGGYAGVNGLRIFMIGVVAYDVDVQVDADRYEVVVSDAQRSGNKFVGGTTATFTATAKDGTAFERWFGDVAESQATNPQVTILIDGNKKLVPYFRSSWMCANGQITDGYWTLNITASVTNLTATTSITNLTTTSLAGVAYDAVGILDLAKEVAGGYQIVEAGMRTCYNRPERLKITELRLPECLSTIGFEAFIGCSNLTNVNIGANVTTVDGGAFSNCGKLHGFNGTSDIVLGKLTAIGRYAFAGCKSIAGKAVIGGDASVSYLNRSSNTGMFEGCSSLKQVIAGNGVTTLGDSAVASCGSLTNITLGTGYAAFEKCFAYQCGQLTDVNCAGTIAVIGASAFLGCTSLQRFNGSTDFVFDRLTKVGRGMFGKCKSLSGRVVIGGKQSTTYEVADDVGAFEQSTVREVIVGDGVGTLGEYPFADCPTVSNIVLGAAIKSLPKLYFMNATGLKTLSFGTYPKGNANNAFQGVRDYQMLYIVSKDDADWNGYVATNVAPWATLSDDVKAEFSIPGWRKPYGLATNEVDNIRATEWIAYRPQCGMMLLVR